VPRRPGALAWLIAATTLLMLLAGALTLALATAADHLRAATRHRLIVQVVQADRVLRASAVERILAQAAATPGVVAANRIADQDVMRLIDPYIGDMAPSDLPLPALIEVDLAPSADVAAIARVFARSADIRATPAAGEARPFLALLDALQGAALTVMLVTVAATGLIAILAARAALVADRSSLAILHQLGATDRQLSRLVLGRIGREAAVGAAAGLLFAAGAIAAIGLRLTPLGIDGLDPRGWALLAALALALVGLAIAAAWIALRLTLGRAR
jgi:cell division transport system permease protein